MFGLIRRRLSTTADRLLTAENRNRCLACMQASPPIGAKMKQSEAEKKFASVLIPICLNSKGEASMLYTRRSGNLSRHVRQISFPGGIKDPTDVDFIDCALRETEEEIGLPRERIDIWGMGSLLTPPYTAAIMPVLGIIKNFELSELKLNHMEVEEAFTIPITKLIAPGTYHHTQFKSGYSGPVYLVGRNRIWGITGYLTHNFLNCFVPKELREVKHRIKYVKPFKHH